MLCLADQLQAKLRAQSAVSLDVMYGVDALCQVSNDAAVDTVMAAIVGAAGLVPTLAAVQQWQENFTRQQRSTGDGWRTIYASGGRFWLSVTAYR